MDKNTKPASLTTERTNSFDRNKNTVPENNNDQPTADHNYTIELRVDIRAVDNDHAWRFADKLANLIGGNTTAIFDEDWEELRSSDVTGETQT